MHASDPVLLQSYHVATNLAGSLGEAYPLNERADVPEGPLADAVGGLSAEQLEDVLSVFLTRHLPADSPLRVRTCVVSAHIPCSRNNFQGLAPSLDL
jgi:hypothetical protein